jgi:EAL domain-containing protein (putative c-di-GMP-specific phosphodiesterase class I)
MIVNTVKDTLQRAGLPAERLVLEVTESTLITETDKIRATMQELRALGSRLAVDDFGTGYSSLAYLKNLRPSKLKIDRSFVRDIEDDPDDRVIVQAIVSLAHSLGIRVVAEGVETEGQRAFLCDIGCELIQGYLVSRPQPAVDAARFMCGAREPAGTAA